MIKVSKIFRFLIYVAVFFLCEFIYIIAPGFMEGNATFIRFFIGLLGVLSALFIHLKQKRFGKISSAYSMAEKYLLLYTFIIAIVLTMTVFKYHYSTNEVFFVIAPYLYIYYSLPLIYIYEHRGMQIIKKVANILLIMLAVKTFCWLFYKSTGTIIFEKLVLLYGDWIRNDSIRIDPGCLFILVFSLFVMYSLTKQKCNKYKIAVVLLMLFVVFITQYRFQVISVIVSLIIAIYISSNNKTVKKNRVIIGITVALLFVALGGLNTVLSSFSLDGEYAGSTLVRINTIIHYWKLMVENKAIFGLGMLNHGNEICYDMMLRINAWGEKSWFYLADIGVLGGIAQFGLLAIPLYGYLFYYGIKVLKMCLNKNKKEYSILLACLLSYLMFSNLGLNVFDSQRAFILPFYLSLISYFNKECLHDKSVIN